MSCNGYNKSRGCPCTFKGKFSIDDKMWCGVHKPHEIVECSICMDEVKTKADSKTLPCGHKFHSGCMLKWGNSSQANAHTCPMCRTPWREYIPKLYSSSVELEPIPIDEFEEDESLIIDLSGIAELVLEMLL